jgi:antitoxin component YwqK of YwqJK toxin-antitoxin module|tara:strand:+ start:120 stop:344 length:225 start_codon:yes stop_codon:yes gene_type:complete
MKQLLTILCLVLLVSCSDNKVDEFYYDSGQLEQRRTYEGDKELTEYFYKNGQLQRRENYKNGKMDGLQEMRNEK